MTGGFDEPLWFLLAAAGGLILWLARWRRAARVPRPSLAFFPSSRERPRSARRAPPPSAWLAAGAAVIGAAALAGPRASGGDAVWLVFDRSAAMAWRDASGVSRFERASGLAAAWLGRERPGEVVWAFVPGRMGRGTWGEAREAILAATPLREAADWEGCFAALPPSARGAVYTATSGRSPAGFETWRFGAIAENVGILGAAAGPPARLSVVNAGHGARRVRAGFAGAWRELEVPPRGAASVECPESWEGTVVGVESADGLPDASPLDDAAPVPCAGVRLEFDPDCPAALRRALEAWGAARGEPRARSPRLETGPLGGALAAGASRIEYATTSALRDHGQELRLRRAPGVEAPDPSGAGSLRGIPVDVDRAWWIDAARADRALAGTLGSRARIGFDAGANAIARDPSFPVLVASLAEEVLAQSQAPPLALSLVLDPGVARDDVEPASEPRERGRSDRSLAGALSAAALVLACGAASFAARGR